MLVLIRRFAIHLGKADQGDRTNRHSKSQMKRMGEARWNPIQRESSDLSRESHQTTHTG